MKITDKTLNLVSSYTKILLLFLLRFLSILWLSSYPKSQLIYQEERETSRAFVFIAHTAPNSRTVYEWTFKIRGLTQKLKCGLKERLPLDGEGAKQFDPKSFHLRKKMEDQQKKTAIYRLISPSGNIPFKIMHKLW